MQLNEYQAKAMTTCMEQSKNDVYAINGLAAESGEIQDKIAKWTRKGLITVNNNCIDFNAKGFMDAGIDPITELVKEVGDVLWFVSLMAERLGVSLEEIAEANLSKLASRKSRNVIDGSGDNR